MGGALIAENMLSGGSFLHIKSGGPYRITDLAAYHCSVTFVICTGWRKNVSLTLSTLSFVRLQGLKPKK
jgi:hypothetical protein